MLGVPDPKLDGSSGQLAPKPCASPTLIAELGEIASELRAVIGPSCRFTGLDQANPIEEPIVQPAQRRAEESNQGSNLLPLVAMISLVAISGVGLWAKSSFFDDHRKMVGRYRPASPAEAHGFLAKNSVDPELLLENQPYAKLNAPLTDSSVDDAPKRSNGEPLGESLPRSGPISGPLTPVPVPLKGELVPLPDPVHIDSADPQTQNQKVEREPDSSFHGMEAKLRTTVMQNGGHIRTVRESDDGSQKTFLIDAPASLAHGIETLLESQFQASISVSDTAEDPESPPRDPQAAEAVSSAETNAANIKRQLDQAEISFLPEAPYVKGLRNQYAEALRFVGDAKRSAHPDVLIHATLSRS